MLQGFNLFYIAIAVFALLLIGIFLTYREFHQQTLAQEKRQHSKQERHKAPH